MEPSSGEIFQQLLKQDQNTQRWTQTHTCREIGNNVGYLDDMSFICESNPVCSFPYLSSNRN